MNKLTDIKAQIEKGLGSDEVAEYEQKLGTSDFPTITRTTLCSEITTQFESECFTSLLTRFCAHSAASADRLRVARSDRAREALAQARCRPSPVVPRRPP